MDLTFYLLTYSDGTITYCTRCGAELIVWPGGLGAECPNGHAQERNNVHVGFFMDRVYKGEKDAA